MLMYLNCGVYNQLTVAWCGTVKLVSKENRLECWKCVKVKVCKFVIHGKTR